MNSLRFASVVLAFTAIASIPAAADEPATKPGAPQVRDLAEYRAKYPTVLTKHGPSPKIWQSTAPLKLPAGANEVTFDSGPLKLKAWLSDAPKDGKLHPAVVFCHGGFWFGNDDWDAIKPLLDAGFIVMAPRWRGENGNPGDFELYYGEVDDVIAAGRFLAKADGVDTRRIFVCGHSAGANLAALAVTKDSPFALAAPIGASLDIRGAGQWKNERSKALIVFDPDNIHEVESRSALLFTAKMRAPVHLFQGSKDGDGATQKNFLLLAHHFNRPATLTVVEGDHFQSQTTAMPKIAALFNDYAPDRRVTLDLPDGWQTSQLPAKATAQQQISNPNLRAYCQVFSESNDLFSGDVDVAAYANLVKKATEQTTRLGKRRETDPEAGSVDNIPYVTYDTTGFFQQTNLHYRKFYVKTNHFFVQLVCWTTEADFNAASAAMAQLVTKVREVSE